MSFKKLNKEQDPQRFHEVKFNMMDAVMKSLADYGYEKTKQYLLKTQFKVVFDIIDDGMSPEKETRNCIVKTLVDHYNESAKFIQKPTIDIPEKYKD